MSTFDGPEDWPVGNSCRMLRNAKEPETVTARSRADS